MFNLRLLAFLFFTGISTVLKGQTFTSSQNGPWNAASTWGDIGIPDASNSSLIIVNHVVNVPSSYSVSIDQATVNGTLQIDAGGVATIADGTGTDLTIGGSGVLTVSGTVIKNSTAVISGTLTSNTSFLSGSVYRHLNTGTEGTIPLATWNSNSTLEITGYTTGRTMASATWSQNFGNVLIDCLALAGTLNFNGLLTNIQGNLTIQNTNSNVIQLSPTQTRTITIGGDLNVLGTTRIYFTTAGNLTLIIGGDFVFNSTNPNGSFFCSLGVATANITGDFSMNASGGILYSGAGSPSNGLGTFNIGGDFTLLAGSLRENGSSSQGSINFNSSGAHTFTNLGSIVGTFDYRIFSDDTLILPSSSALVGIDGTGVTSDLVLEGTIVVQSTEALGAIRNGTSQGNIRTPVATRTYNSGSTIIYRSSVAAQNIGDGHPNSAGVNLIIDNPFGVSFASNVNSLTVTGDFTLQSGNVTLTSSSTSAKTLTLSGNIDLNNNFLAFSGPNSDLVINGAGTAILSFSPDAESVRNFTLNRATGATMASSITISGSLTLTSGDLVFNDQTLTLNGTTTVSSGRLSSNASSVLVIGGSGSFGTLPSFAPSGNTLGTLTLNRVFGGSVTISSSLLISSTLNLANGNLTNSGGLTMGNGSTISRSSTSLLLTNRPATEVGGSYNVIYSGSTITTGLELPLPSDDVSLNDLTIAGTVNLNQDIIVNGTFSLISNVLNVGTFIITMQGSSWLDNAGTFNPGTSVVIFNGNTTVGGSSVPNFRNIQVNNSATLTFPVGNVTISGNIIINSGGIFNSNNGTITLTGAVLQTIDANGQTFHNLAVNKIGGSDVLLSSQLNVTGLITIQTSGIDLNSSGNLTILSTSDGPSGNGSIGALPNGATITGNVTVQRYMSAEGSLNRYISSPVSNATVAQLQDDFSITGPFSGSSYPCSGCLNNGFSLKYYDESFLGPIDKGYKGYPTIDNSEALERGRGYLAFMWDGASQITWDLTGTVNTGTINLPVTLTTSAPSDPDSDGWNLVGNPYPSSIIWNNGAGWTKTNIAPTIYVPDNVAGVFRTWNANTLTGDLAGGEIATGQSFWVYASASAPLLRVNEQAKSTTTGTFYREKKITIPTLVVGISEGNRKDNSFLMLIDGATDEFDPQFDALKLEAEDLSISFASEDGSKLVMSAMTKFIDEMVLPLSTRMTENKNYEISFESQNGFSLESWKLFDKKTSDFINLDNQRSYIFESDSNPQLLTSRFLLVKGDVKLGLEEHLSRIYIYPNPATDKVNVEWNGKVPAEIQFLNYLGGQVLMKKAIEGGSAELDIRDCEPGLYIIRVFAEERVTTHKLIKR